MAPICAIEKLSKSHCRRNLGECLIDLISFWESDLMQDTGGGEPDGGCTALNLK